jgi:hypothetical protein
VTAGAARYAGTMRYPDGGGLTAAERARRERVRLAAQLRELDVLLHRIGWSVQCPVTAFSARHGAYDLVGPY